SGLFVVGGGAGDEGARSRADRFVARNYVPALMQRLVLRHRQGDLVAVEARDRVDRHVVVRREEESLLDDAEGRGGPDHLANLLAVGTNDVDPFRNLPLAFGALHGRPLAEGVEHGVSAPKTVVPDTHGGPERVPPRPYAKLTATPPLPVQTVSLLPR